jgi:uncharacterized protein
MITLHQASIPSCLRALASLAHVLAKGEAQCAARSIDPATLLQARLHPEMFPLVRQVQIACDTAIRLGARLVGMAPPSTPDTEANFAELQHRIAQVVAFLEALQPEQFEGGETRALEIPFGKAPLHLSGLGYLQGFAIPTLYFHVVTAYAILRHNGVDIGKRDYLGDLTA